MTAPLKSIEGTSIADAMADIGRARQGGRANTGTSPAYQRDAALTAMARSVRASEAGVPGGQRRGRRRGEGRRHERGVSDRLTLTPKIVAGMAAGIEWCATSPILSAP